MVKIGISVLLSLVFTSCTNSLEKVSFTDSETPIYFSEFPQFPILHIEFSDSINFSVLERHNFKQEDNYFFNQTDSTYIVPVDDSFNEFLFYFKKKSDINLSQELFEFIKTDSVLINGDYIFSDIKALNSQFTFTYFTTNNFIRLHYKKTQIWH